MINTKTIILTNSKAINLVVAKATMTSRKPSSPEEGGTRCLTLV
jgi:hypothetical protein